MPAEPRFPRPALMQGIAALMVLLWMTGCALRRPPALPEPLAPPDAEAVLTRARSINRSLQTFKGIGRLEIRTPDRRRTVRAAWAVNLKEAEFRLDFIEAGFPAASLAGDGRRVYWRRSGEVRTLPVSDPRLDDLTGLPLTVADLLQAMAGRLPAAPCSRVGVHPDPATDGVQVVFYDRFGAPRVRAMLEGRGERLRWLAYHRSDGGLQYRIDYGAYRPAGSRWLPHRIEVSDERNVCRITVERWRPDVPLDASVFVLEPPPSTSVGEAAGGAQR